MKICPICQSSYEDAVDFCFKDGAPLEAGVPDEPPEAAEEQAPVPSLDDLDPPEAMSMSIPSLGSVVGSRMDNITMAPGDLDVPEPESAPELASMPASVDEDDAVFEAVAVSDDSGLDLPDATSLELPPDPVGDAQIEGEDQEGGDEDGDEDEGEDEGEADGDEDSFYGSEDEEDEEDEEDWGTESVSDSYEVAAEASRGGKSKVVIGVVAALSLVVLWQVFGLLGGEVSTGPAEGTTQADVPAPSPAPAVLPPPAPATAPVATGGELADGSDSEGEEQPGAGGAADGQGEAAGVDGLVAQDPEPTGETDSAEASAPSTAQKPAVASSRASSSEKAERSERPKKTQKAPTAKPKPVTRRVDKPAASSSSGGAPPPPFDLGPAAVTARPPSRSPAPSSAPAAPAAPVDPANPWGTVAVSQGSVSISTQPSGAKVAVDGRSRGKAPLKLELPFGDHEVRVEYPGYATQTRVLKVVGTKTIGLDVVLESLKRVATGTLNVVTPGPAVLFVDGVRKGITPLAVSISAGSHKFRLEVEGKPPHEETLDVKLDGEGSSMTHFFRLP